MAHRDTDTLKWDDSWYQALSLSEKLLWLYICDKCDQAGVWKENRPLAEFQIGCRIDWNASIASLGDRVVIHGDRWVIPSFIPFHYGRLTETHKMYKKVCSCLAYHKMTYNLDTISIVYLNEGNTLSQNENSVKDKDKDKGKDILIQNVQNRHREKYLAFKASYPKNGSSIDPNVENWFINHWQEHDADMAVSAAALYDAFCRTTKPDTYPHDTYIMQAKNFLFDKKYAMDWAAKAAAHKPKGGGKIGKEWKKHLTVSKPGN